MSLTGKRELGGAQLGRACPSRDRPGVKTVKSAIRSNAGLLQNDLYLNPDPLVWLIGEANETDIKLEGQSFKALVDSGSMLSQITNSLAKALKLPIKQLQTLIPMEGSGGITVPYLGYVEATLDIPEVKAFHEDCLFLVMNDHNYGKHVPITIDTLHIDMIIDQATKEELDKISIAWGQGQLFRQIQACQVQIENQDTLQKVQGTVKLMRKVKLKPFQSLKLSCKGNNPLNSKWVNVVVEPLEDVGIEDNYAVPACSFLKSNSRRVYVGLRKHELSICYIEKRNSDSQAFTR